METTVWQSWPRFEARYVTVCSHYDGANSFDVASVNLVSKSMAISRLSFLAASPFPSDSAFGKVSYGFLEFNAKLTREPQHAGAKNRFVGNGRQAFRLDVGI